MSGGHPWSAAVNAEKEARKRFMAAEADWRVAVDKVLSIIDAQIAGAMAAK